MANINDIARIAGVSRATVSRVLMNSDKVRPETAELVKKAIKQTRYQPSMMARGLATGRLNLIALLMSETENPFFLQMVGKMDQGFRKYGYIMSICYLGDDAKTRCDNLVSLSRYGFSGFIIGDISREPSFLQAIREARQQFIFFNRHVDELSGYDAILCDNHRGGYMATRHLIELGHKRIGMLTGPLSSSASLDRFSGFRQAMEEAGLAVDPDLLGEGDLDFDSGSLYAKKILGRKRNKCTAVFAGNDPMAIGILNYCREMGIRVPESLSLVGFDDIALSSTAFINLTTVKQPYVEMSSNIVDCMMARLGNKVRDGKKIILDTALILRKTTAPKGTP